MNPSCVECPDYLLQILELIAEKMSNMNGKVELTPFDNSGKSFSNDVFELNAYDWGNNYQPHNFKWRDVEISWYKHLGRMTTVNRDVNLDEARELFNECFNSLL